MKKAVTIGRGAVLLLLGALFIAGCSLGSSDQTTSTPSPSAAKGTRPYCELYMQDLANHLNVSVSTLEQDQKAALEDMLQQQVKDGKLTQKEVDALKAGIDAQQACTQPTGGGNVVLNAMKQYLPGIASQIASGLHLSVSQLEAQVRSGKSLNAIAAAQHVSLAQLHTIELNAIQSPLKQAASNGDITQQQANSLLQQAQRNPQFLDALVKMIVA